ENKIKEYGKDLSSKEFWRQIKVAGFSNRRLTQLLKVPLKTIQEKQQQFNVKPVYRRIDTCGAEFPSSTAYLYSTYLPHDSSENACESYPSNRQKVVIIGSGPNHIGQGIEFDY